MDVDDFFDERESSSKRQAEVPAWLENLPEDQLKEVQEGMQAWVRRREGGSRIGVSHLVEWIKMKTGKVWSPTTLRKHLAETYGNGWR